MGDIEKSSTAHETLGTPSLAAIRRALLEGIVLPCEGQPGRPSFLLLAHRCAAACFCLCVFRFVSTATVAVSGMQHPHQGRQAAVRPHELSCMSAAGGNDACRLFPLFDKISEMCEGMGIHCVAETQAEAKASAANHDTCWQVRADRG
jgi:hypothetical protein